MENMSQLQVYASKIAGELPSLSAMLFNLKDVPIHT